MKRDAEYRIVMACFALLFVLFYFALVILPESRLLKSEGDFIGTVTEARKITIIAGEPLYRVTCKYNPFYISSDTVMIGDSLFNLNGQVILKPKRKE